MKKKFVVEKITPVEPEESRCITVDSPRRLFMAGGDDGKSVPSHNSVLQRNIIVSAIMRPDYYYFLGIDLKRVELSAYRPYKNVVLRIATELEEAVDVLRFASQTMMKRYDQMEKLGVNNFLDLPKRPKVLLIMVDEMGQLLSMEKASALAGDTLVWTIFGKKPLEEIQVGDVLLDSRLEPTKVVEKYEPCSQEKYLLKFQRESDEMEEEFLAGAEHLWVVSYQKKDSNGREENVETVVDTKELFTLFHDSSLSDLRFRRRKVAPAS